MSEGHDPDRGARAVAVGLAAAVAGYLPAAIVYDHVSRWLSPMRHAEEAMGRGLEVIFIGAPLGALALAVVAGMLTYRGNSRATTRLVLAAVAAFAILSVVIAQWSNLL